MPGPFDAATTPDEPTPDIEIGRIHPDKVVLWNGQLFIESRNLEAAPGDDYYNHAVGMVIRVKQKAYEEAFVYLDEEYDHYYELASVVTGEFKGEEIHGYWLIRLDPEDMLAHLPVTLNRNATDGPKEA